MAEKPILFSGEMVRAILEGRKTQTRRLINFDKIGNTYGATKDCYNAYGYVTIRRNTMICTPWSEERIMQLLRCPYRLGDLLWVRETWATGPQWDNAKPSELPVNGVLVYYIEDDFGEYKKRPSIFMPRWASRITLRVTDVRVERVQDISEEDAIAEGINLIDHNCYENYMVNSDWTFEGRNQRNFHAVEHPILSFASLWDSINAKRGFGWDANPWVWVVEFELCTS